MSEIFNGMARPFQAEKQEGTTGGKGAKGEVRTNFTGEKYEVQEFTSDVPLRPEDIASLVLDANQGSEQTVIVKVEETQGE